MAFEVVEETLVRFFQAHCIDQGAEILCVATEAVNEDEGVGACAELFDIEELRSDTG
jgi:hypothetical protein